MSSKVEEDAGAAGVARDVTSVDGIERLNSMAAADLQAAFERCCSSPRWATKLCAARPFSNVEALLEAADAAWWALGPDVWREGFNGHSRLGKKKAEQKSAMSSASSATLSELDSAVAAYEERFGFACIIYAAGRSAADILAITKRRTANEIASELRVAAEQVAMITRLRLETLVCGEGRVPHRGDGRSPITTHILDTAVGRPGHGVALQLQIQSTTPDDSGTCSWRPLSSGVTNSDGRVLDLLPPTYNLRTGVYRVVFSVAPYFAAQGKDTFFPEVVIAFVIKAPTEHYHVPLLLSPHGYTTYRGS